MLLGFTFAPPAAAQVAVGGVMRFATADVAFHGGFGGVAVDVWRLEPYGYLSHDAGVWGDLGGHRGAGRAPGSPSASPSAWEPARRSPGRPSSRTCTRPWGPACASAGGSGYWPRWTAKAFTLWRGGLFVGW